MEPVNNQPASFGQGRINTCDIILPTYKKDQSLKQALSALHAQIIPHHWAVRVIVCDDGSPSASQDIVDGFVWTRQWIAPFVIPLAHVGRARARNAGIAQATADIILFLADDILLRQGSLNAHLVFHENNPDAHAAAVGWVLWDPRIRPTPFMEWMTHGGQQNNYDALLGQAECDAHSYFYGSHVSVKRALMQGDVFSEKFTAYGWEDLELGGRLQAKGMRLSVLQSASALHAHWYGAEELLLRQQMIGAQKYLVNTNTARIVRHALYQLSGTRFLCILIMKIWGNKLNIPSFFQFVIAGEFWYGVHHANKVLKRKKQ